MIKASLISYPYKCQFWYHIMYFWAIWLLTKMEFILCYTRPITALKFFELSLFSLINSVWLKYDKFELNFLLNKKFRIFFIFYLHFTWLYGIRLTKDFFKLPFWKYDSYFSSEVSKLPSVFCYWNDAFSGIKKIILTNNNVITFDPTKI